jgi:hypothetical protein
MNPTEAPLGLPGMAQDASCDAGRVKVAPAGTGRPKSGYKNKDGKRVPGCTTIVGRFKDSGGLIQWAYKCGLDGLDINKVRDDAADAGSLAHDMIDAHLHKGIAPSAIGLVGTNAEHAFLGYLEWAEQTNLKVEASEISLVSERHQFGGTFDAVVSAGKLVLLDYKTSSGIYTDMLIQVAGGYSLLWAEHYPDKPLQGMDLLRISKPQDEHSPVSFHHHHWSAEIFLIAQEAFLHMRAMYELDKKLKGLL